MNNKVAVLEELRKASQHIPSDWIPAEYYERDYIDGEGKVRTFKGFRLLGYDAHMGDSGIRTIQQYKQMLVDYNLQR